MMKSFLILAGAAVMLAQPAYGLFDFGASDDENDALGGFSDLLSGFGDNDVDNRHGCFAPMSRPAQRAARPKA